MLLVVESRWRCDMATIPCKYCREAVSPIASRCIHCRRLLFHGLLEALLGIEGLVLLIGIVVLAQNFGGR